MNPNQLNAILKAFAWQNWHHANDFVTSVYFRKQLSNTITLLAYLPRFNEVELTILISCITKLKNSLESLVVAFPQNASASEIFLLTLTALINCEKEAEKTFRVV